MKPQSTVSSTIVDHIKDGTEEFELKRFGTTVKIPNEGLKVEKEYRMKNERTSEEDYDYSSISELKKHGIIVSNNGAHRLYEDDDIKRHSLLINNLLEELDDEQEELKPSADSSYFLGGCI